MSYELNPFDSKSALDFKLQATVNVQFFKKRAHFQIDYCLQGALDSLLLPPDLKKKEERAHDLWKETCFEAFLKIKGLNSYLEFNFSPSGNWNCYYFDSYRAGMRDFLDIKNMTLNFHSGKELNLKCLFDLELSEDSDLTILNNDNLRMGLSAILFQKSKGPSYFALAHPASLPDFHHEKSFILNLGSPGPY